MGCNSSMGAAHPQGEAPQMAVVKVSQEKETVEKGQLRNTVIAMQAEGHPEVVLRDTPIEGRIVAMVPNGEPMDILQRGGESIKVQWKAIQGWVKTCNVQEMSQATVPGGGAVEPQCDAPGSHSPERNQGPQVALADAVTDDLLDPIGFWEYVGDDGKFIPYTRDESRELDAARDTKSEFPVAVCLGGMKVEVSFHRDPKDGAIKLGTQRSSTTKRERQIRREVSAKELVESARSAIEKCMQDPPVVGAPKYTEPESIWEILERDTEPVKLIRGSWVTEYANNDGLHKGLPRRQDLEETVERRAFLPRAEVKCIGGEFLISRCMNVVGISYCWRAAKHPDADGQQLRLIEPKIKGLMQHEVFSQTFTEIGVFWDFCSLHQKNQHGNRSQKEWRQFNEALQDMGIWYLHAMIMTFIVNVNVANEPGVDYQSRGWTHFERSCAEMIKTTYAAKGVPDSDYATWAMITEFEKSSRKIPMPPEIFAAQLAHKHFTSRGDKETVVGLYTNAFMDAVRGTGSMDVSDIKLLQDGKVLASVLQHCCNVESLAMDRMDIDDIQMQTLAAVLPSMARLQRFFLSDNKIGDAGATAIANVLPSVPRLDNLYLDGNTFGDAGAIAIANALESMPWFECVSLHHNKIDDAGATAIANVLPRMPSFKELDLEYNKIGDIGANAVAVALPRMQLKMEKIAIIDGNILTEDGQKTFRQAVNIHQQRA